MLYMLVVMRNISESVPSNSASRKRGKYARVTSIVVLFFGLAFIFGGLAMSSVAESGRVTAKELQASGHNGVVDDARVSIARNQSGMFSALTVELKFTGEDGSSHTLTTSHFPRFYPPLNSKQGWLEDFPTKAQIVGQEVKYRLGDRPAVELNQELPALVSSGRGFFSYLGLGFAGVGGVLMIVGAVLLVRSFRP